MALLKKRKDELVADYSNRVRKSTGLVMAEYSGINMPGLNKLRASLRDVQAEFHIIKNTLAEVALKQNGLPVPGGEFTHSTGTAFAFGDPTALAKAMLAFAKESEFIKIKGGVLGKRALSPDEVKTLASLPPLTTVRAQLIGMLNAPARNLAGVLAAPARNVANVIKAYADTAEVEPLATGN